MESRSPFAALEQYSFRICDLIHQKNIEIRWLSQCERSRSLRRCHSVLFLFNQERNWTWEQISSLTDLLSLIEWDFLLALALRNIKPSTDNFMHKKRTVVKWHVIIRQISLLKQKKLSETNLFQPIFVGEDMNRFSGDFNRVSWGTLAPVRATSSTSLFTSV